MSYNQPTYRGTRREHLGDAVSNQIVYVFSFPHGTKIGTTQNKSLVRLRGIEKAVGLPGEEVLIVGVDSLPQAHKIEKKTLARFTQERMLGEWISAPAETVAKVVAEEARLCA